FVKYAESYGAQGHRVSKIDDLATLLQKTLSEPDVHLIEVPVDYSDNDRILNEEIQERSKKI
ncbi:MAG: acetolactate synthase-1/2/3 large subunit, partial [Planctomycetota bacterium]